ncbi:MULTISPECIES: YfaP family protein [Idiomarina]|uniref:YfaP family protein n=1 Tax=Idiomarina TaxID=135575 RepID=UPI00129C3E7D|nr:MULTISPECIES: hypothetical protein [Idiomarina]MRJ42732.1 hypothetical protein [Idiomarina sp. FeN1]NCU58296.1 hypothetical protein [Idiomarina sp. FenA--70]NCU60994.1 hypothetical protein [Idiomarina sp. FenBw--71]UUN14141.1 hypothetical protein KGF88_02665 [Idiomarina loihiensis]
MRISTTYQGLQQSLKVMAWVASLTLLAACSSDSKDDDPVTPPPPPPPPPASYTLAGTATGLAGAVELSANDESLTVSEDGDFAFTTEWDDETTVDLAVVAAPDGQACTIDPEQVTFAGEDITDLALTCEDEVVAPTFAMQCTVAGNSRELTLNYSINGEAYSQALTTGDVQLEQPVSPGDQVQLSVDELVGHTCSVTPAEFTVGETAPSIEVTCSTFGSVSVLVTDYQTAMPIADASVEAYVFSGEAGAVIEDDSAYLLLDNVQTNSEGRVTISGVGYQERLVLRAVADGFASRSDVARTSTENPITSTSVAMIAVDAQVNFDAAAATMVTVTDSPMAVDLPANAFVNAAGEVVTGEVTAKLTNIDASSDPDIMPGEYEAYDPEQDVVQLIESFGAIDASFSDSSGGAINLAEGTQATIRIPLAQRATSPPATIPLIHFNEVTGIWEVEGEATLQTDSSSGAQYYEGVVGHFSTWNADVLFDSIRVNGCVFEEDGVTPRRNVRIRAEGVNYIGRSSAYTNGEGDYSIRVRPNSQILISVDDASGISTTFPLVTGSEDMTLPECVVAVPGAMRVTLTWGENPRDLDTHFMGPTVPNGEASTERFRIYYSNSNQTVNGVTIDLDVDDTSSYGPEVTTVPAFPYPGIYRYAVHHYSGSGTVFQSPTRVELQVNGENYVFAPSQDEDTDGTNDTWIAFDLEVAEDGSVSVIRVDQYVPRANSDIGNDGANSMMLFPEKSVD